MVSEKRVLVADDDPSIRQLLCTLIKRENVKVDCVADGEQAIEMIRQHHYAVILLDLMMPRVDGFGVIEHLSSVASEGSSKPIVFIVTAYADETFKRANSRVVSGVIHKPFDVTEIGSLVRHCVFGSDPEVSRLLQSSTDRAIRDFTLLRRSQTTDGSGNRQH